MEFDLLIQNGLIYNGEQSNPVTGDIGIKGETIAAVGKLDYKAAHTVDAEGQVIAPGFIDVHTHCDMFFKQMGDFLDPDNPIPGVASNHNYLHQGVTTVVSGNCGYGFTDMNPFFDLLDRLGFASNVFNLVPHGDIRDALFGKETQGALTRKQLDMFNAHVAGEMEKGAVGLSAGLEFPPGLHSPTEELISLCRTVRSHGGIFTIHMRDESAAFDANGRYGVEASLAEAIEIGRQAEIPVEISHLKISRPFNDRTATTVLEIIANAKDEGLDITADQYPYEAGSQFLSFLLPSELTHSSGVLETVRNEKGRKTLASAVRSVFEHIAPDRIMVTVATGFESFEGQSIEAIADQEKQSPVDMFVKLTCLEDQPMCIYFNQDMEIVRDIMADSSIITASDGWTIPENYSRPHPRFFGTFPRKIRFALTEGRIDLVSAIRSMTALPAERFNMKKRGRLLEGYFADIVVFDPDTIIDQSTYLSPHQYPDGINHVFINGRPALKNGKPTNQPTGKRERNT